MSFGPEACEICPKVLRKVYVIFQDLSRRTHKGPYGPIYGPYGPIYGPIKAHMGPYMGHMGPNPDRAPTRTGLQPGPGLQCCWSFMCIRSGTAQDAPSPLRTIDLHLHSCENCIVADDRSTSTSTSFAIWFDLDLISFRSIRNTPNEHVHKVLASIHIWICQAL